MELVFIQSKLIFIQSLAGIAIILIGMFGGMVWEALFD